MADNKPPIILFWDAEGLSSLSPSLLSFGAIALDINKIIEIADLIRQAVLDATEDYRITLDTQGDITEAIENMLRDFQYDLEQKMQFDVNDIKSSIHALYYLVATGGIGAIGSVDFYRKHPHTLINSTNMIGAMTPMKLSDYDLTATLWQLINDGAIITRVNYGSTDERNLILNFVANGLPLSVLGKAQHNIDLTKAAIRAHEAPQNYYTKVEINSHGSGFSLISFLIANDMAEHMVKFANTPHSQKIMALIDEKRRNEDDFTHAQALELLIQGVTEGAHQAQYDATAAALVALTIMTRDPELWEILEYFGQAENIKAFLQEQDFFKWLMRYPEKDSNQEKSFATGSYVEQRHFLYPMGSNLTGAIISSRRNSLETIICIDIDVQNVGVSTYQKMAQAIQHAYTQPTADARSNALEKIFNNSTFKTLLRRLYLDSSPVLQPTKAAYDTGHIGIGANKLDILKEKIAVLDGIPHNMREQFSKDYFAHLRTFDKERDLVANWSHVSKKEAFALLGFHFKDGRITTPAEKIEQYQAMKVFFANEKDWEEIMKPVLQKVLYRNARDLLAEIEPQTVQKFDRDIAKAAQTLAKNKYYNEYKSGQALTRSLTTKGMSAEMAGHFNDYLKAVVIPHNNFIMAMHIGLAMSETVYYHGGWYVRKSCLESKAQPRRIANHGDNFEKVAYNFAQSLSDSPIRVPNLYANNHDKVRLDSKDYVRVHVPYPNRVLKNMASLLPEDHLDKIGLSTEKLATIDTTHPMFNEYAEQQPLWEKMAKLVESLGIFNEPIVTRPPNAPER